MWRHFRGDFLIYAFSKVLIGISSFILLRLLTSAMPPADYGLYALIFAIVTVTTTIATSFLTNAVTRYLPGAAERHRMRPFDKALLEISTPTVIGALVATALALGIAHFAGIISLSGPIVAASLVASAAAAAFQIYSIYCYSDRRRILYSAMMIAQIVFFLIGAAALPWIPVDTVTAAIGLFAASYVLPLLLFRMPRPALTLIPSRASWPQVAQFLRYGAPLIALNFSVQLNTYLDQFMLRSMRGATDVGLYAANYVVADKVVYALSSVISITIAPLIFREWERNNKAASLEIVWKSIIIFLTISIPVLVVVLALADPIMNFLTGPDYAPGRVIIPYVMAGALMSGMASIAAYVHTLLLRTGELAIIYFIGIVCGFLANLILIPKFGLVGCAYSTLFSFTVLFMTMLLRAQMLSGFIEYLKPALLSLSRGRI